MKTNNFQDFNEFRTNFLEIELSTIKDSDLLEFLIQEVEVGLFHCTPLDILLKEGETDAIMDYLRKVLIISQMAAIPLSEFSPRLFPKIPSIPLEHFVCLTRQTAYFKELCTSLSEKDNPFYKEVERYIEFNVLLPRLREYFNVDDLASYPISVVGCYIKERCINSRKLDLAPEEMRLLQKNKPELDLDSPQGKMTLEIRRFFGEALVKSEALVGAWHVDVLLVIPPGFSLILDGEEIEEVIFEDDGISHEEEVQKRKDEERDRLFKENKKIVFRFNKHNRHTLKSVLQNIKDQLQEKIEMLVEDKQQTEPAKPENKQDTLLPEENVSEPLIETRSLAEILSPLLSESSNTLSDDLIDFSINHCSENDECKEVFKNEIIKVLASIKNESLPSAFLEWYNYHAAHQVLEDHKINPDRSRTFAEHPDNIVCYIEAVYKNNPDFFDQHAFYFSKNFGPTAMLSMLAYKMQAQIKLIECSMTLGKRIFIVNPYENEKAKYTMELMYDVDQDGFQLLSYEEVSLENTSLVDQQPVLAVVNPTFVARHFPSLSQDKYDAAGLEAFFSFREEVLDVLSARLACLDQEKDRLRRIILAFYDANKKQMKHVEEQKTSYRERFEAEKVTYGVEQEKLNQLKQEKPSRGYRELLESQEQKVKNLERLIETIRLRFEKMQEDLLSILEKVSHIESNLPEFEVLLRRESQKQPPSNRQKRKKKALKSPVSDVIEFSFQKESTFYHVERILPALIKQDVKHLMAHMVTNEEYMKPLFEAWAMIIEGKKIKRNDRSIDQRYANIDFFRESFIIIRDVFSFLLKKAKTEEAAYFIEVFVDKYLNMNDLLILKDILAKFIVMMVVRKDALPELINLCDYHPILREALFNIIFKMPVFRQPSFFISCAQSGPVLTAIVHFIAKHPDGEEKRQFECALESRFEPDYINYDEFRQTGLYSESEYGLSTIYAKYFNKKNPVLALVVHVLLDVGDDPYSEMLISMPLDIMENFILPYMKEELEKEEIVKLLKRIVSNEKSMLLLTRIMPIMNAFLKKLDNDKITNNLLLSLFRLLLDGDEHCSIQENIVCLCSLIDAAHEIPINIKKRLSTHLAKQEELQAYYLLALLKMQDISKAAIDTLIEEVRFIPKKISAQLLRLLNKQDRPFKLDSFLSKVSDRPLSLGKVLDNTSSLSSSSAFFANNASSSMLDCTNSR